jgi:hypothetical protein
VEIRDGGGCLSAFGIPFLAAGVFTTLIGLGIVPVQNAADVPVWVWPLIVLMGLAFVVVGGGLVFGRRWITVDAGRGLLVKQWGLLVPLRREEQSLQGYDAVAVRFESGDSDSAERYPVVLRAKGGGSDLALSSPTAYAEARHGAALIARVLRVPLVDATTDHESVTDPDRADAPLREQLRGEGQEEQAPRPPQMRSQVQDYGSRVQIAIPGPGFKPRMLLGFAIPAGLFAYAVPDVLRFFDQTRTPAFVQMAFLGVAVFFFCVLPFLGVLNRIRRATRGGTLISASPEGLTIEERGAWRSRVTRVPVGDILGLDYGTADSSLGAARRLAEQRAQGSRYGRTSTTPAPGWLRALRMFAKSRGVVVKTKQGFFTFGAGLPDAEVHYLHDLVRQVYRGAGDSHW